jgi:hypothetical protein
MDMIDRDETSANPGAKQRPAEKQILRARPIEGEVDWAELSREHIARFPKILTKLAQ